MIKQVDDDDVETKVLDFGIAKVLADDPHSQNLTSNEELLGTLKYMTPEQFLGAPVDARSDVFGICLIAYEMLSGIVPPAVMSLAQPLHELCDVSERLSEIILKGLSQSPEQRQQSAALLKKELDNLEQDIMMGIINDGNSESSGFFYNNTTGNKTGKQNPNATNQTSRNNTTARKQREALQKQQSVAPEKSLTPSQEAISYDSPKSGSKAMIFVAIAVFLLLGAGGVVGYKYYTDSATTQGTQDPIKLPGMVKIRADSFKMGNNKDNYSSPEHDVKVESFQVSRFLITNNQYAAFVKDTNHKPFPTNWRGSDAPPSDMLETAVTTISWRDAQSYCDWLTRKTGLSYRLLTEQEWEYLARNQATLGVDQRTEVFEWTSSEAKPYPNSKFKTLFPPESGYYIFRGRAELDNGSKVDPTTFREWEKAGHDASNLGFRVAYKD